MTTDYVLSLADIQATLETVGGKGASLARLSAAGLPVPDGFHVTTAAYRRFVAENGLQPGILAALQTVDPAQPATLEAASRVSMPCSPPVRSPPISPRRSRRPIPTLPVSTQHSPLSTRPSPSVPLPLPRTCPKRASRPARELPQHPRPRSGAGRSETLLGLAMDCSCYCLPSPTRRFDGWAEPGRGRADPCSSRRVGHPLYRQPHHRPTRSGYDQRGLGIGGGGRRRHRDAGYGGGRKGDKAGRFA